MEATVDLTLESTLTDPQPELDDSKLAHIVAVPKVMDAQVIVHEARAMRRPVTALCGHKWVPASDPEKHPLCQPCLDTLAGIHRQSE